MHHFAYGWVTPALAYLLSYLGSLSGLAATVRARRTRDRGRRARWLFLAAWAIGGTGIWAMHFMAMIGFTVDGTDVRYDVSVTVASWLTAVVVVGVGLFIVGYGRRSVPRVVAAGVLTGLGVAGMHYAGMGAMRLNGSVAYDPTRVALSLVIAVVAATAALWFTVSVRRPVWIAAAAAIMGVAVAGMHYTGMSAMSVHLRSDVTAVSGVVALNYLIPMLVFVLLVVLILVGAALAPSFEDGGVPVAAAAEGPAARSGFGGPPATPDRSGFGARDRSAYRRSVTPNRSGGR